MPLFKATLVLFLIVFYLLIGCTNEDSSTQPSESHQEMSIESDQAEPAQTARPAQDSEVLHEKSHALVSQYGQSLSDFHDLIGQTAVVLLSLSAEGDQSESIEQLNSLTTRFTSLSEHFDGLEPLTTAQLIELQEGAKAKSTAVFDHLQKGMEHARAIVPSSLSLNGPTTRLYHALLSVNPPPAKEQTPAIQSGKPAVVSDNVVGLTFTESPPDADPQAPSAFVVIQNSAPTNPQELVRQLQQVLPKTQVVKQIQSPNPQEVKLEVTNTKDVRALANKIPFASVESVNDQTRTIVVDFDL